MHSFKKVPDYGWNVSVDHAFGILTAILRHEGLGVIPKSLALEYGDKIHIVDCPQGPLTSELFLVQNKGKIPSKVEKDVISLLSRAFH
jgi:DNA-binding transcriptional LysR family regulator